MQVTVLAIRYDYENAPDTGEIMTRTEFNPALQLPPVEEWDIACGLGHFVAQCGESSLSWDGFEARLATPISKQRFDSVVLEGALGAQDFYVQVF